MKYIEYLKSNKSVAAAYAEWRKTSLNSNNNVVANFVAGYNACLNVSKKRKNSKKSTKKKSVLV